MYGAAQTQPPTVLDGRHTRAQEEQGLILRALVEYARCHPGELPALLRLLEVFTRPSFLDLSFLRSFFRQEVAQDYSPQHKRRVLADFLELLPDPACPSELKVLCMRHVVLPMLAATFENPALRNSEVVDAGIVQALMEHAFDPKHFSRTAAAAVAAEGEGAGSGTGSGEGAAAGGEKPLLYPNALLVELHKLATLLIESMGR